MIIRIGKHEVTLVPHEHAHDLFVGDIGPIHIEAYPPGGGRYAEACISLAGDEGCIARICAPTADEAATEAMRIASIRLAERAQLARRDFEQLDVHALNVAARMRETAEVAERARRLIDVL